MRLVYYSISFGTGTRCERQWIQSIRSLRRYNGAVRVHLLTFDSVPDSVLREADRQQVRVYQLGDYREYLRHAFARGDVLALYPTLHKFMSLRDDPAVHDSSQILYLDCDTFFFDDVELLFDQYWSHDWYAREEPMSRRGEFAYHPGHLDEDVLDAIVRDEGLRAVVPFNSGVCLLNNGIWHRVGDLRATFLDFVWRLLVGRELAWAEMPSADVDLQHAILRAVNEYDRSRALPYPSQNTWIVEQIALWLTLGHIGDMTQEMLTADRVQQGGEFVDGHPGAGTCVISHYFSGGEEAFFARVRPI